MISKIITILSSLVLFTVFIFLFKFSIPPVEEYFSSKESKDIVDIKTERFLNRLSFEDREALMKLPCDKRTDREICNRADKMLGIIKEEIGNNAITYLSLFNGKGINLFDNSRLSSKYFSLFNKALESGSLFAIEKDITDESKYNTIYIRGLKESTEKKLDTDIYIISIIDSETLKPHPLKYSMIIGAAFLLPFLFIVLFSLKSINYSKNLARKFEEDNENLLNEVEKLKRENIQQSNFLANFTHELRTPLNSIIGFSGLLKDQTLGQLGNAEYIKYSEDINNAGIHLLSLINDILDYTKAEVGRLKVNVAEVDIVKVIRQCLAIVAPRASESGVELLQSIADEHVIVKIDQKRIKQIILNLLSNSVKFTPEGGSVTVAVFPDVRGERIYIEVKDTGVGIAEKDIPTVMSLFGQAESDLNRKYEGTGIGLPFSKKLTNMLGGTFELSSKQGVGTRVTLGFPFDKKLNAEFIEMVKG